MKKLLLFLLLIQQSSYSEAINYKKNHLHAFLPQPQKLYLMGSFEKVNDTLDILNIKKNEISKDNKNFDSVGDMEGINLNLGYRFSDKWYLNFEWNKKKLQYSGTTLTNQKFDTYIRYQFYHNKNLAFAIDGGFKTNIADDTYVKDLKTINNALNDIASDKELEISGTENKHTLIYREDEGSIKTINLKNTPYLAIVDTEDSTFYGRAIFSFKKNKWIVDTYMGYSETNIQIGTDSSILHENNSDLESQLENISFIQKRRDSMFFGGLGIGYEIDNFYIETNYQYNHILRIDGLNKINKNHILDINIHYSINNNIGFFIGGKMMLNHFNGEIPYLYGEYTDTSFDHKYGFVKSGIIYNF